jgi:hypothetical protein
MRWVWGVRPCPKNCPEEAKVLNYMRKGYLYLSSNFLHAR